MAKTRQNTEPEALRAAVGKSRKLAARVPRETIDGKVGP